MIQLLDGKGKTALIAGAAGGIGSAIGRVFRAAGVRLAAFDLQPADPEIFEVRQQGDASEESAATAAVSEARSRFGRIDFLINAAGLAEASRLDKMALSDWQRLIDANLTSTFLLCREAYPALVASQGAVVLFGSTNALNGGSALSGPAYAAAKAGVVNLTRYLAKEWAEQRIRVNCVAPGPVATRMVERFTRAEKAQLTAAIPFGRFVTPDEIASTTAFLCSSHAAMVTGTVTNVSGGLMLD